MSNVVEFPITQKAISDEQRMRALRFSCESAICGAAKLMRVAFGLDAALRTLGTAADELRKEGRVS